MKKFLTALLLLGFVSAGFAPAIAKNINLVPGGEEEEDEEGPKVVNPYADKYKADIKIDLEDLQSGILPNYIYHAYFLRFPEADPDDFNILVASPGFLSGCLDIEQPSIEVKKNGDTLTFEMVEAGYIDVDFETVRYFHYECKPETGGSSVLLTLSINKLREDGIKQLALKNDTAQSFTKVQIDVQENSITATSTVNDLSKLGVPVGPNASTKTFWFYPENTITLFSSSLDLRDEKTRAEVTKFARAKGLTPLNEIITDFNPLYKHQDKLYVVDKKGIYKNKLTKLEDVITLGKVKTTEVYFGPNGAYDKPIEKALYARLPGLHE